MKKATFADVNVERQASFERRSNCADSATYEVTDPEP